LLNLEPPKGRRVVVLGTGGGVGVNLADACSRAGLEMPPLAKELQKKLRTFIDPAGTMINNPVDAYHVFAMLSLMPNALELFRDEPYLDMMIMTLQLDWLGDIAKGEHAANLADFLANEARKYLEGMPLVVCCFTSRNEPELNQTVNMVEQKLLKAGVPAYKDFYQAANSLVGFAEYHQFLREIQD
jgi:acyl-CoA synthetase (NDP forming)